MIAFGMHFFGADLNWWETLIVLALAPGWLLIFGLLWDQ